MGALIKLLLTLALLAAVVIGGGAWLVLAEQPLVTRNVEMTHDDVARARDVLNRNDPRRQPTGTYQTVEITAQDLDLALNYLLRRYAADAKAHARLEGEQLLIDASVRDPSVEWRPYLNIAIAITSEGGRPRLSGLRAGALPVPDIVSNWLLTKLLDDLAARSSNVLGHDLVHDLKLSEERLQLTYRWHPAVIEQARETLLSGSDREALRYYHDELVALQAQGIGRRGSLVELLQAMFTAARTRSQARDPVLENTALLTVLGTWGSRHDLARLVPGDIARPGSFRLKLHGRTDFAQHFVASAALAARGDSTLSDAVGLFKEINDTDHGSGFSFTDIAADRAGTRFGELLTSSRPAARRLQQRLADGIRESDIMPRVDDLPEHMSSAVFKQRFGHVGSPAYHATMDEIERRISACALYGG